MNILLTSAGRRSYIVEYFKNCNGIDKIFAANSEYTIALQKADGYFISPLIYSENYIQCIVDYCLKNKITAVLSLFDIDLLVLAKNEKVFEENGIKLILAPKEFIQICNDKYETYKFCEKLGLKTPKSYINIDDVFNALEKKEITYPIIMKPRWGMASLGVYKVENEDELVIFTKKCKREIFDSYLKYESSMTPDNAILYQELVVGKEYGIDVINDLNGNYIDSFAKQKVTMRSGETDLGLTVNSKPFSNYMKIISNSSKHKGILSVDCIQKNNDIYIIEMNCRISGHYPLSYLAGMNYPQLLVDWLNGKDTDFKLLKFQENLYIIKDLVPTVLNK